MYPSQVNLTFRLFAFLHSVLEKPRNCRLEIAPTKVSATVKFITKYMPRVLRSLFFMKRMIDSRFTVTIARETTRTTANQVMHSDEESIVDFSFRFAPFYFPSSFS